MAHNILITGASGYLGGTLLARWREANLTGYDKLFALVRKPGQAQAVEQYGAEPLEFDIEDNDVVKKVILQHQITIVYFLIDAFNSKKQQSFIEALAEVKAKTGQDVHFLHTTGAKMFSSLTGAPTDRPLLDSDPGLFDIHKAQKAPYEMMQVPIQTNITITEEGEKRGVRTYIFAPCIVYGKGEGFGNPISIQTVDVATAAKGAGRVYKLRDDRPTWPVCHVIDNANLYIELLRAILEGKNPDHGKQGFYLASSGSVAWDDLYGAIANAMVNRGVIKDAAVVRADDSALEKMASALGASKDTVEIRVGGKSTYTADRGKKLGWKPQYPPEHILDDAENEVELILQTMQARKTTA
ncbi:L-2-aminoadipate reductase [Elsinoe australis]|uniref:L-2-aminoadipate reductase n=1 Tax=Elsinoe australis TaxID=40998 RepID=A0A2P7YGM3_9PEZI|nr:L-2-aminoadipate reductase [Elsinoe australis]